MQVNSSNVTYDNDSIQATYQYKFSSVEKLANGQVKVTPKATEY